MGAFTTNNSTGLMVVSAVAFGMWAAVPTPSRADTVLVSPANMNGWAFDSRDVSGTITPNPGSSGSLVTGPATPPLGIGSANLTAGTGSLGGDGSEELSTNQFNGTHVSSLTALIYSTYDVVNNSSQFPYLTLAVSLTGNGIADDKLFFEPPYQTTTSGNPSLPDQGDTAMNTWQQWNALEGGWWDNDNMCGPGTGVESLSACLGSDFTTATIVTDGYGLGGIGLNVGFGSAGDQFNGNVDAVTVGVNGSNTTFNFEPTPVPEPASLSLFAGALIGLWGFTWLRRRKAS